LVEMPCVNTHWWKCLVQIPIGWNVLYKYPLVEMPSINTHWLKCLVWIPIGWNALYKYPLDICIKKIRNNIGKKPYFIRRYVPISHNRYTYSNTGYSLYNLWLSRGWSKLEWVCCVKTELAPNISLRAIPIPPSSSPPTLIHNTGYN
jgi:hypothetical protein